MTIYLLFCLCCFIIMLLATKLLDGQVTLDDLCFMLLFSLIPIHNLMCVLYTIVLIISKYGDKRIF